MSTLKLPYYDREMGCCSCFGFLQKPDKSVDSDWGCSKKGPSNRAMCREISVKETVCVRESQSNGKKMLNGYIRERKLGCGSYGKVTLYRNTSDGKHYAIKAFCKSRLAKVRVAPSETAMMDVRREVSILKTLEHPNIVNLIEVIDDPEADQYYMVLEYVEGKSICDPAGTPNGTEERTARRYFRDIIAGLLYLHDHNVVHGDIKPDNLLVTSSGRVKIADFSVSRTFEDANDELSRSPGTPAFTAPECCVGLAYHGKAADIWALGVTLYCLILGNCPFIGDSFQETFNKIVNGPLSLPEDIDPELKDLLQNLLCKDPWQRITLGTLAKHPWVVREGGQVIRSSCRCKITSFEKTSSIKAENTNGLSHGYSIKS